MSREEWMSEAGFDSGVLADLKSGGKSLRRNSRDLNRIEKTLQACRKIRAVSPRMEWAASIGTVAGGVGAAILDQYQSLPIEAVLLLGAIMGLVVGGVIYRLLNFAKTPIDYLDWKLTEYDPFLKKEYIDLQETLRIKGILDVEIIGQWFEVERQAVKQALSRYVVESVDVPPKSSFLRRHIT